MFSLFRRKASPEQAFKSRVQHFWHWYAKAAPRLYQTIEEKNAEKLHPEICAKVDELILGCAWVFGAGKNGEGHSFTLTAEGDPHLQFLTEYWKSQAPTLAGWTFYSARQASQDLPNWCIEINEETFRPNEFWLALTVNNEQEKIDMTAWHPLFARLPEKERWTVLFLVLDEALGEFGTQSWIGEIDISDKNLTDALPLKELPKFIRNIELTTGWRKFPPTDTWTTYTLKEPHDRFRRGDIIAGTGCNMALVDAFLKSADRLDDPLDKTGADFVFVQFDRTILPAGQEVRARGDIEDALSQSLLFSETGRHIGGGMGTKYAYIDLLLYDGYASLEVVKKTLFAQSLPKGTSIEFFAHEKRDRRIIL